MGWEYRGCCVTLVRYLNSGSLELLRLARGGQAQPSAGMSGRAPQRFADAIVLARLILVPGAPVWLPFQPQTACHASRAPLSLQMHSWALIRAAPGHSGQSGPETT